MWRVSGIKIEHTRARYFFLQSDKEINENWNFFTLWAVTRKRREILGWVIKGQMMTMHRGPNSFFDQNWLLVSFDCVLVTRSQLRATKYDPYAKKKIPPQFSKYRCQNESHASQRLWANAHSLWKRYFEDCDRICFFWHCNFRFVFFKRGSTSAVRKSAFNTSYPLCHTYS